MSKVKRHIKKERARKHKEKVYECIKGSRCQYSEAECVEERDDLRKQFYDRQIEIIKKEYPQNADGKIEIVLDDWTWTTIQARVFMSIRKFSIINYQSTLEAKVCEDCENNNEKLKSLMLEHQSILSQISDKDRIAQVSFHDLATITRSLLF